MTLHTTGCLATVLALAGCGGSKPAPAGAATTEAAPVVVAAPSAPQVVDETRVTAVSAEHLARAEWTRQGCSLDSVDGQADAIALDKGQPHVFRGYLVDDAQAPAGSFQFVLKGAASHALPATTGWPRPDVAEFFKVAGLSTSGFEFSTTLEAVPPGDYQVAFLIGRGERLLFCESDKTV